MMIHDHCYACGVKRPMLLGYAIVSDAMLPACSACLAEHFESYPDATVQMFAMDVHGHYGRVYPYDGLVADLQASYRPEAYRWN